MNAISIPEPELRRPPENLQAERGLLGAILTSKRAYERVADIVRPEHFADRANGQIFAACAKLIDRGQLANPVTLKTYLESDDDVNAAGGIKYLVGLASAGAIAINAVDYARIVRETWARRELIIAARNAEEDAWSPQDEDTAETIRERLEQALADLSVGQSGDLSDLTTVMHSTIDAWTNQAKSGDVGLSYGFPSLDEQLGLMGPGDFIVLGGRPSMGKTALSRAIALRVAQQFAEAARADGKPPKHVLYFSSEMRNQKQVGAYLTGFTGVAPPNRRGPMKTQDIEALTHAAATYADLPLLFDDTPAVTLSQVRQMARKVQRMPGGLGLIVVDFLQLMGIERGLRISNPVERITYLSGGLKEIAGQTRAPLIALSQLSRAVEQRDDKRPQLSDLRESGAIEQDADVVGLLYRAQYYLERERPEQRPNEKDQDFSKRLLQHTGRLERAAGQCEIGAAKVRLGAVGRVMLRFDGPRMLFTDPADDERAPANNEAPVQGDLELR